MMLYETVAQLAQAVSLDPMSVVWFGVPAMFLIVGTIQVLKQAGLPSRFAGVASLLLGVAGGLLLASTGEVSYAAAVVSGAMAGLAASGAWSVGVAIRASD